MTPVSVAFCHFRLDSNLIVKISDFGLARSIKENEYHTMNHDEEMPVRWMSPEALKDKFFSSKSDVVNTVVTTN